MGVAMDFCTISESTKDKSKITEIYPTFGVRRSYDLMVRGNSFYAIWDEDKGLWSTDEYDVVRLVDEELANYKEYLLGRELASKLIVKKMENFNNGVWSKFQNFVNNLPDNFHQLDSKITFKSQKIRKDDYVSKRLSYDLSKDDCPAWRELTGLLYSREELDKIEWAIGSIFAGDSTSIQKFLVFYGEAGTGKSTVLNVIQQLFDGYYTAFDSKALGTHANSFSTETFRSNPLVAIQHDGDLSRIDDNARLNSIISHEEMVLNEKYKSSYVSKINALLFMGTNKPVKISDARSGLIRRLIDVHPTGEKHAPDKYIQLMSQIKFELGAIANHCLELYRELGRNYYNNYVPIDMMYQTDILFNFVSEYADKFLSEEYTLLNQAWAWYKEYLMDSGSDYRLLKKDFRESLKPYFAQYIDRRKLDGKDLRCIFYGFKPEKLIQGKLIKATETATPMISLDETESLLDEMLATCPAQYSSEKGTPTQKWVDVKTRLKDLDTTKEHYVRLPENHIVIDFDLKGDDGEKSAERNIEEASKWPRTYAEYSRSGGGIHLHYIYEGDPATLAREYAEGVEIKVFTGLASLRRRLSYCNNIPVATLSDGLPQKEHRMINADSVKSERGLRALIERNLRKEIHPGTKPSVDFIYKILEDAYESGMHYDITDMRPAILAFANNSTNQALYCVKLVKQMKFKSEDASIVKEAGKDMPIVFFDVEVYPNLFIIVWKAAGKSACIKLINPTPEDVEGLMRMRLVGFNNRRYDNHILYGRLMGYSNEELFKLSQRLINGSRNGTFAEAYGISYADVYDFSTKKQSLKKFEIELGLHHQEMGLPWDEPVDEKKWLAVADYCANDVLATEAVFEARKGDYMARKLLADLSGLRVNDTTAKHAAKIIFGDVKEPQKDFVYTDLSEKFPGYKFDHGVSTYMGEQPGEGGYVYAEPGYYENVTVLDVASMHPNSMRALNLFGPYTKRFTDILDARVAIKHKDIEAAKTMLDGHLVPYLEPDKLGDLAQALKIVINSVYGLTAASFENPFRDPRNIDNIVAKRGALFMITLKHEVQKRGYTVAHIKTDSIKIPNADEEIISFVTKFGKSYGYNFEVENIYHSMTLVNDAVYIAQHDDGSWEAVGAQFQSPYVFKTLFSGESIEHEDLGETRGVKSEMYLDFNETLPEGEHNYLFVGKVGRFVPVKEGCNGGVLYRHDDDKYYSVTGTKGWRWKEYEVVDSLGLWDDVDYSYYQEKVEAAKQTLAEFTSYDNIIQRSTK